MRNQFSIGLRVAVYAVVLVSGFSQAAISERSDPAHGQHPEVPLDEGGYPYQLRERRSGKLPRALNIHFDHDGINTKANSAAHKAKCAASGPDAKVATILMDDSTRRRTVSPIGV